MNDIGEVHGKKRRGLLLPAFSHVRIKGLMPGLWPKGVEMMERVEGIVRASQSGASSGGEEGVLVEVGSGAH